MRTRAKDFIDIKTYAVTYSFQILNPRTKTWTYLANGSTFAVVAKYDTGAERDAAQARVRKCRKLEDVRAALGWEPN